MRLRKKSVAILSLLGRVYMRPVDCPFLAADRVLGELPPEVTTTVSYLTVVPSDTANCTR